MAGSSLVQKLRIKPGHRMILINAPSGYRDELGALPENVELADTQEGTFDFVQLFVKNRKEVQEILPAAVQALKPDGLLWVCYPKGSSKVETDLNRDILWSELGKYGLNGVSLISVNDIWSAMRCRSLD